MLARFLTMCFLLFISYVLCYGQVARDTTWKRSDYIANTDEYLSVKINGYNDTDRLRLTSDNYLDIRPNTDVRNRISVNYKWLTLGFSFKVPTLFGNDDQTKGDTKTSGFSTAVNLDRWSFGFDFDRNVGYYLENSKNYLPNPSANDFITFPDFTTNTYRLNIGYLTNTRFSLKALTSLTERQLQSSGSFIPFLRFTLFTTDHQDLELINFDSSTNFQVSTGLSYNYKLILFENFYVGGVGSVGGGWINSRFDSDTVLTRSSNNSLLSYAYGVNFGYNAKRFFFGGLFKSSSTSYSTINDIDINTRINSFEIFLGYRFWVPKFLRKPLNWADDTKNRIIK